ncbi:MAG: transporter [Sphingomonas bacterium]|jgi:multidrug efflux system outer membrane protein|uniref:efflux transporter outer membrane subunit n=1 Tax=Sphingomonas bacterium TaxID=1895847 RepID=UPI002605DD74|nr:efflux transporter outer membrane subunit [Sphingomonas bacterium]MDB5710553.1 transporter [Sphingomonas bacterium]
MIRRVVILTLTATSLASCSMEPHYVRPALPVPPSWPVGDAYLVQSEASLPSVTYQQVFRDTRLQTIIGQALANNRDLRIAAANIEIARATYHIQRAELLPEIDATGGYRYARTGSTSSTTGTTGTGTTTTTSNARTTTGLSADVGITSFEIDLFGRVRSLTHAAQNRYFETEAAARATRLTLVGDIATTWLTYASDKSLLKIATDTAASAERSVKLTKMRLDGGIAPRTDLDQANLVLQTAQSDVASQTTVLAQDVNALQLLVGASIDNALLPDSIEEVSPTVAELPPGLDSGILFRRPDVLQAEYELRATNADIGAARAALFPRISLTALIGFASSGLSNLFTNGAFNYSVAPNVSYPIFRAGAGRAGVAQSRAQRDSALATYEKAIQTAFREVADALARRGTIDAQLRAQQALAAASADNYKLSDARYRGGIDTFLNSLDAQRSLYSARRTLVAAQLTKATNLVTLYRTLGGDSQLEPAPGGPKPANEATPPR